MKQKLPVDHLVYSTTRSFELVAAALKSEAGRTSPACIATAATNVADFETRVNAKIGSSGFTRFLTLDHGDWLTFFGQPRKARQHIIGNPLIAITMLRHDIRVGLNVPVRVYIYRDDKSGTTRFEYDKPSTLMSGLDNPDVIAAAETLDARLAALAEQVIGTRAEATSP